MKALRDYQYTAQQRPRKINGNARLLCRLRLLPTAADSTSASGFTEPNEPGVHQAGVSLRPLASSAITTRAWTCTWEALALFRTRSSRGVRRRRTSICFDFRTFGPREDRSTSPLLAIHPILGCARSRPAVHSKPSLAPPPTTTPAALKIHAEPVAQLCTQRLIAPNTTRNARNKHRAQSPSRTTITTPPSTASSTPVAHDHGVNDSDLDPDVDFNVDVSTPSPIPPPVSPVVLVHSPAES